MSAAQNGEAGNTPAAAAAPKKNTGAWLFFAATVVLYGVVYFLKPETFAKSWKFFLGSLGQIAPVFVLVFAIMLVVNRYVTRAFVLKHLRGKGPLVWLYFIAGGIVSTGPIYMWYPLLRDLRQSGVSNPQIACFLYNRSIKITWLPVMVSYFGVPFVVVTTLLMVALSLVQAAMIWALTGNGDAAPGSAEQEPQP